ncbi:reverse transcriptase N-terminal domain-containing protein [Fischerella sp. PCC 9605]|uniref:reverse transcriptase N-terminal domain-containing protein n=1 Tax=Fischerella sp. PCC 9605 TaxID=1173024 RepID=UPI003FA4CC83
MIRHSSNTSESWKKLPWKKFRCNLFRLQKRVYKAVQVGDYRKAKSLQKLILKSTAARLLAIRQNQPIPCRTGDENQREENQAHRYDRWL